MSYFRDNIDAMTPYVPGEQPAPGRKVVKLNTNENPYPPGPAVIQAMHNCDGETLRRYPDPMARRACEAAAKALGVPVDRVLAGNGSDELLTMICRACAAGGRPVVYPVPTYILYGTLARIQDAEVVEAPYDDDYNVPVDDLIAAGGAVTLVATPNSPSGTVAPAPELERLAAGLSGLLVIDEAYVDFADTSAIALVETCGNVIVLRTLSKGYSLAGLRLGFAIAQEPLLATLVKVKDSYNVDSVACAVGAAALEDQAHKNQNAEKVKASRAVLTGRLQALGFRVWPSQANFLLARPPQGDAGEIYEALKSRAILVRYFKEPRLDDKLRITVGTDAQNAALVEALKEILGS